MKCRSNTFFAVFFCYPTICVISFAAFICKQMNPDDSVLEMDDAVMCEDPGHRAMQWASLAVIIVVAFGLPVLLLVTLVKKTTKYDTEMKGKNAETAKRMAVELDVSVEAAEFVIRDITIGRDLSFVSKSYRQLSDQ